MTSKTRTDRLRAEAAYSNPTIHHSPFDCYGPSHAVIFPRQWGKSRFLPSGYKKTPDKTGGRDGCDETGKDDEQGAETRATD